MTDIEQISLRRATADDASYIHTAHLNYPWLARCPHVFITQAAVKESVETDLYFVIQHGMNDVGHVALTQVDSWNRSAEIGVAIWERRNWNMDLAASALAALTKIAFDDMGLGRVWARPAAWNTFSIAAGKRAGFLFEGRTRQSVLHVGKLVDELLFGMVKED